MYCKNCGNKMDDNATICPQCETITEKHPLYDVGSKASEKASAGWGVLAFFIPIVGIILAIVYFDSNRSRALVCLKGVLVNTCLSILISFISSCVYIVRFFRSSFDGSSSISGTGPGWNSRPSEGNSVTDSFIYPSPPSQSNATYNNSDDGVLTFCMTRENCPTFYDAETNTVALYDWDELYVYDAASGAKLYEHAFGSDKTIKCAAAYGGKVAVGFGKAQELCVLDLKTLVLGSYITTIDVFEVELTNDAVLYVDNDQWCEVHMLSLTNGTKQVLINGVYRPHIAVNREKGILYVAETHLSSCDLIYVNIATKESSQKTDFGQYEYSNYDVMYDGEYVHAMGNLYDPTKGKIVAAGQCSVKDQSGWSPYSTLCTDGKYSLTITTDCKTVVYNNSSKKIEYTMDLYATRIYAVGGNKYVALCGDSGYFALIDLNKM